MFLALLDASASVLASFLGKTHPRPSLARVSMQVLLWFHMKRSQDMTQPTHDSFGAPTRSAAQTLLTGFAGKMGRSYERLRNFDFGSQDRSNISCLSPYVRHRLILERDLARAALEAHPYKECEKFLQEVFWRTYWKGWLEMRPQVWRDYCSQRDADFARTQGDVLQSKLSAALAGETGIACFDAWANELREVGYLHNHARMWFASTWIFTLNLPWTLGADFFLRHLMDGDAASNTLSWRWVAGLQTQGKTYLATSHNIAKFTDGRFNVPAGDLADAAPALAWRDPPAPKLPDMTQTIPDHAYTLFLHEEDANFETLELARPPERVLVQAVPIERGPQSLGARAAAFTQGALEDVYARASQHFNCPVSRADITSLADVEDLYAAHVPIGPLRDALGSVSFVTRAEDSLLWPHAAKGFFKFKNAIPNAIDTLGLGAS